MSEIIDHASRRYRLQRTEGRSLAFWGVIMLSLTEGVLFVNLLFSYYYLWSVSPDWPPAGVAPPEVTTVAIRSVGLWASSLTIWFGERAMRRGDRRRVWTWTVVTILLAVAFMVGHVQEFMELPAEYTWSDHAYGSLVYTILNFHGAHVLVGIAIWLFILVRLGRGAYGPEDETQYSTAAIYWHFVDAVWLFVFPTIYLFPHVVAAGG